MVWPFASDIRPIAAAAAVCAGLLLATDAAMAQAPGGPPPPQRPPPQVRGPLGPSQATMSQGAGRPSLGPGVAAPPPGPVVAGSPLQPGGPPVIPRTDIIMAASSTDPLQGFTSGARRDWGMSSERLVAAAEALGDVSTVRLVAGVVDALRQLEGGEHAGAYVPLPFGGRPTAILPPILSFRPAAARSTDERRSRAELIARSPVLFGATGY